MLNRWHFIHEPAIWGREWGALPGDALRYRANDNRPIRLTPIQISRGQDSLCTVFAL